MNRFYREQSFRVKISNNPIGVQMFRQLSHILFLLTFAMFMGLSQEAVAEEEKSVGMVIAIIGSVDFISSENELVAEAGQVQKV